MTAKKRAVFFVLLLLLILFLVGLTLFKNSQKFDDIIVKNLGISSTKINSDPSLFSYPWKPTSATKILPFNYTIPVNPGSNISIRACPDQFESVSFIIKASKDISGISITTLGFYDDQGHSIPANAINIRTVKAWYQAAETDVRIGNTSGSYLTPELLLKDDSLLVIDYENKTNYLKVTLNGSQQYIDISNPNATFPKNANVQDAQSLQPFSLKSNENKQIWVTIHIPPNTPSGNYTGMLIVKAPPETPVEMNFTVTVLPFNLESPPIEYAIYYYGVIPETTPQLQNAGINSFFKSPRQYTSELTDMKDHGVVYPTVSNWYGEDDRFDETLRQALLLRSQLGLPNDHIYALSLETGNATNARDLLFLENYINKWEKLSSQFGYREVYVYGMDEVRGEELLSERPAWQIVHNVGAKVFVAISDNKDAVNVVGDLLDVAVLAGPLDASQALKWHSYGKRIFSYSNPQVGVENPAIYRQNYGFSLWNAGYDGVMDFAYQFNYGHIWNDFDSSSTHYRDHVFAYPTSDGVIDTVQWEGFREGVDDTRYLATLIKIEGNSTSAKKIVSDSLANGEDPAQIREKVIGQILLDRQIASNSSGTQT